MKKFLMFLTIFLTSIIFTNCVSAKSVTHYTDLFGDISFDIQELATQNNISVTDNYVLFKRTNGSDVVLILEAKEHSFYYYYSYWETGKISLSNRKYENDTYTDISLLKYVFIYNSSTNEFENNKTSSTNFSFYFKDIYYSTIDIEKFDGYEYSDYFVKSIDVNNISSRFIDVTNLSDTEFDNLGDDTLSKAKDWCDKYIQEYNDVDSYFILGDYIGFYNSSDNAYISVRLSGNNESYGLNVSLKFLGNDTIKYIARVIYDIPQFNSSTGRYINQLSIGYYKNDVFTYSTSDKYFYGNIPIVYDNNADYDVTRLNSTLSADDYYFKNVLFEDNELCYTITDKYVIYENNDFNFRRYYSYENLIDTTDVEKIEINFDTSKNNGSFSFDLDFLMQFSDNYIPKPYLESWSTYDSEDISQIENFLNDMEDTMSTDKYGNEVYQYTGKFGLDFIKCKKLKLIIDTSSTIDSVYLKFTSSINFNINFISTTEEENYYETINLDNIYGVYLIPKVINADNFSTIYTNGIYNIQVRNNFNEENYEILYEKINFNKKIFQYQYYFNNNNCLIYFENTKYNTNDDDSYYITFDTRYFNYTIKENFTIKPIIKNPNTGEDQIIDNIIIIEENNSIIDNLKNSFNKGIFDSFTAVYNKIRSAKLGQYLFIVIIGSILILYIKSMKK